MKATILTGLGINSDQEMALAWKLAGAETECVHLSSLEYAFPETDLLVFPGGFAYGDHLGAGRALANHLKLWKIKDKVESLVRNGGSVLGICNGFQVLVALGLLPGWEERGEVTLAPNASRTFLDRWVRLRVETASPFLSGLKTLYLPIRHGEGRLLVQNKETLHRLWEEGHVALTYQEDINGSVDQIAALTDASGRILGMMPHPEAALFPFNSPYFLRKPANEGEGLPLFKNLVAHYKEASCQAT